MSARRQRERLLNGVISELRDVRGKRAYVSNRIRIIIASTHVQLSPLAPMRSTHTRDCLQIDDYHMCSALGTANT